MFFDITQKISQKKSNPIKMKKGQKISTEKKIPIQKKK